MSDYRLGIRVPRSASIVARARGFLIPNPCFLWAFILGQRRGAFNRNRLRRGMAVVATSIISRTYKADWLWRFSPFAESLDPPNPPFRVEPSFALGYASAVGYASA